VLGIDAVELEQRPIDELVHPDDIGLLGALEPGARHRRLELRMRHRNGYWLTIEAVANDMSDDAHIDALVLTVRDVSERKAFEEQLRHRAFQDPLTQLANRALFLDRLQHALSREGRFEDLVAVLFVDLDDFKLINDSLGHARIVAVARQRPRHGSPPRRSPAGPGRSASHRTLVIEGSVLAWQRWGVCALCGRDSD
jgi:Diguanylate cyclase, GGDEF domain